MSLRYLMGTLVLMTAAAPAWAQPAPPAGRGGPPDFAEMRQRMAEQMKQALDVNDEAWKQLGPKIEKVHRLQRDLSVGGGMGMMFGPGPGGPPMGFGGRDGFRPGGPGPATRPAADNDGPPPDDRGPGPGGPPGGPGGDFGFGPGGDHHHSAVQQKFEDLQDTLDDKDAKPQDIKAKIEAFHKARTLAKADLAKAQDELRAMLNPQQEAVLITMGVLD